MSANTLTVMAERRALPVRLEWLALVASLAVGVAYDAAVLFKYPFAVGVDGYYYVLQINELRTQGRLYSSSSDNPCIADMSEHAACHQ